MCTPVFISRAKTYRKKDWKQKPSFEETVEHRCWNKIPANYENMRSKEKGRKLPSPI